MQQETEKERPMFPDNKTKAFTLSYDDGVVTDSRFVDSLINTV